MKVIRAHFFVWYAYTGKKLCAPGGKWAKRDMIAFEAAFTDALNG